ncbi:hypothetical protein N9052_01360 [bacterium]|nr:hypothetical protein [bacterium]
MRASDTTKIAKTLFISLAALGLAAMLTMLAYLLLFERLNPEFAPSMSSPVSPLILHGSQFEPLIAGAGGVYGDATIITKLRDRKAILQAKVSTPSERYVFMELQTRGLRPDIELEFYWRTAEKPKKNMGAVLTPGRQGRYLFNLAGQEDWQGTITSLALGIYGDLGEQPLELQGLTLHGFSPRLLLTTLWQEWSGYRVWSMSSINRLEGIPSGGIQYLTPMLAVWAAFASLMVLLLGRPLGLSLPIAIGMTLMVPWLILDSLWQAQLTKQLGETRLEYDGKPPQERYIHPQDTVLHEYASRLKLEVLEGISPRLFVIHQSDGHNFDRLRLQYHLLPHNIYNFGMRARASKVRAGDYILLLGDPGENHYNAETGRLISRPGNTIHADIIDTDPLGKVFRVSR